MQAGRPIVASIGLDTPAAELLRSSEASLLVQPEDPDALAGAMQLLRDDPKLRAQLGEQGRAYAEAQLTSRVGRASSARL